MRTPRRRKGRSSSRMHPLPGRSCTAPASIRIGHALEERNNKSSLCSLGQVLPRHATHRDLLSVRRLLLVRGLVGKHVLQAKRGALHRPLARCVHPPAPRRLLNACCRCCLWMPGTLEQDMAHDALLHHGGIMRAPHLTATCVRPLRTTLHMLGILQHCGVA